MAFDVKAKIEEIVQKVTKDPDFKAQFTKNPVKAVESVVGVDLPDDVVKQVVTGVKGKVSMDKLSDMAGSIKKLF